MNFVRQVYTLKHESPHYYRDDTIPVTVFTELGVPDELATTIQLGDYLLDVLNKLNSFTQRIDFSESSSPFFRSLNEPDIYMDDISLPPPSSIRVFYENNSTISPLSPSSPLEQPDITPANSIANTGVDHPKSFPPQCSTSENCSTSDCVVCGKETSRAHTCPGCYMYVHVIYGRSDGEEFGSSVWCNKCDLGLKQKEAGAQRIGLKRWQDELHRRMLKSNVTTFCFLLLSQT